MITQVVVVSVHTGVFGEQVQRGTQTPSSVCGSTLQHMDPFSQLSTPLAPPPWATQVSPGPTGFGSTGTHLVAFHEVPPLLAHAVHFSPGPQSWVQTSHSMAGGRSGSMMKPPPPVEPPVVAPANGPWTSAGEDLRARGRVKVGGGVGGPPAPWMHMGGDGAMGWQSFPPVVPAVPEPEEDALPMPVEVPDDVELPWEVEVDVTVPEEEDDPVEVWVVEVVALVELPVDPLPPEPPEQPATVTANTIESEARWTPCRP